MIYTSHGNSLGTILSQEYAPVVSHCQSKYHPITKSSSKNKNGRMNNIRDRGNILYLGLGKEYFRIYHIDILDG